VKFPLNPTKVMGLAPSVTEMLAFILPYDRIVGKTILCDFPSDLKDKPSIVVYPDVDIEKILTLKPDILFTVEGMTPLSTAEKLESLGIPVYYFSFHQLEDVFSNLHLASELLHIDAKNKIDTLKSSLLIKDYKEYNINALGVVSIMPIYVYGVHSLLQDQMRLAGIKNAIKTHEQENYPLISVEELLKMNPDLLIMSGDANENLDAFLATYPQLSHLSCMQKDKIITIDANLLSRPGPRSVECVLELRKKLAELK